MGNILAQIKKKQPEGDAAVNSMVNDISRRALAEAMVTAKEEVRSSLRGEMDSLRFKIQSLGEDLAAERAISITLRGEVDTAKSLHRAAQEAQGPLKKRITQLAASIKLEQNTLKSKVAEMKEAAGELKAELAAARSEAQDLRVENAKLTGKLDKPAPVKKVVAKQRQAIPDFEISNLVRGHDGRIVSGKITVERPK